MHGHVAGPQGVDADGDDKMNVDSSSSLRNATVPAGSNNMEDIQIDTPLSLHAQPSASSSGGGSGGNVVDDLVAQQQRYDEYSFGFAHAKSAEGDGEQLNRHEAHKPKQPE